MLLRRETELLQTSKKQMVRLRPWYFTLYITCINQTINTIQYPPAYEMDTTKKTYMCIRLGRVQ